MEAPSSSAALTDYDPFSDHFEVLHDRAADRGSSGTTASAASETPAAAAITETPASAASPQTAHAVAAASASTSSSSSASMTPSITVPPTFEQYTSAGASTLHGFALFSSVIEGIRSEIARMM